MDSIVRTIANTVLRATVYKGMRGMGFPSAIGLAIVAAFFILISR